jgi:phage shock protein E
MLNAISGASSYTGEYYIDIRTEEEWKAGHRPGAENFDLESMELGFLPMVPKTTRLAVYSNTGIRARRATDILQKNGFTFSRCAGSLENAMKE